MTRSHATPARDEQHAQAADAAVCVTAPSVTPADISAALLELLRKVNAEVPTRQAVTGRAQAAVENYRRIANDLRTPSDPPATYSTSNATRAA